MPHLLKKNKMAHHYHEYIFTVSPHQPGTEILIAELGDVGFESFMETEEGVKAYIADDLWRKDILDNIDVLQSNEFKIAYDYSKIEQVNWNEEWERNFEPIEVNENCVVRAPFHEKRGVAYELIITPKMSFGTGHHETTYMMLQYILEDDFKDTSVLDMGCGTAVLAILTEKRGAKNIDAIDIDEWCVENSKENIEQNNCSKITVIQGEASILETNKYDVVIANINRNILLEDMKMYAKAMKSDAVLYISGFYSEDLDALKSHCAQFKLEFISKKEKNNWNAAKFIRN